MAATSVEVADSSKHSNSFDKFNHSDESNSSKSSDRSKDERWPVLLVSQDSSFRKSNKKTKRDPVLIERTNLLNVSKLVVKELIESSLKYGRMLDSDHVPLQHFFIVLEHVMRHGLKPKKGLLGPKKELWNVLETTEKYMPEAHDITASVRDLPTVKTPMGRARAWLRLALMQKKLADYFKCLIDKKEEILNEFYEPNSMMMSEEAIVIGGLLVGLNVIDCNLCVKEEDLDSQQGVIDFSLYLRDNNHLANNAEGVEPTTMTTVLDQKNYIEELNRHLNATVTNLQAKVENLMTTNALMKEDLAIAKNQILQLQEDNSRLMQHQQCMVSEHNRKLEDAKADINAERETYQMSRAGLDTMYHETRKKLNDETQNRIVRDDDTEKELQLQITMRNEMEVAMKLLEKDIHEKQDTIVSLRRQLDDIKFINLEMYKKLQECETSLKHKTEIVNRLEQKTKQMSDTIRQMEAKNSKLEQDRSAFEETVRQLGQQMAEKDLKRSALETDLKIEREWRTSLQESLISEKDRICQLQMDLAHVASISQEYEGLKISHEQLQKTCEDNMQTLHDLATHLGESKLKMEDLKEASQAYKEAVWLSDKDALHCCQCKKEFSIARRKHHCRNCGEIFCGSCSDNTMPLPSSAKPVRVCDGCHTLLLQRYLAKS